METIKTISLPPLTNTPGVYRINCKATGGFYVGASKKLSQRACFHADTLAKGVCHNPKLQAAYDEYGPDQFEFEVIEHVADPSIVFAREGMWVNKLSPTFNKRADKSKRARAKVFQVTIPRELRDRIAPIAEADERSICATAQILLDAAIELFNYRKAQTGRRHYDCLMLAKWARRKTDEVEGLIVMGKANAD